MTMIKCIELSASLSSAAGGIFEIELALSRQLSALRVGIVAKGLRDEQWLVDSQRWKGIPAEVFETRGPRAYGYAPELLDSMIHSDADLAHLHYMWMYPSVAVTKWAKITNNPYLVTPNGMLEPWALSNSALKKKIAGFFYEKRMLRGAACLQANTEKELIDIRAYGLRNPVCIIPNGIDLPTGAGKFEGSSVQFSGGKKALLFLGRLHPKKGLINALRAWKSADPAEWQFVIAGWDQGGHEADLKRLCDELGLGYSDIPASEFTTDRQAMAAINASVIFVGPAFGDVKEQLLRQATAFILPSFSEGLPMSVLEAWSYGLPVLMTDYCNIPEGFAAEAALRIGTDVESISAGLRQLFAAPAGDLQLLGRNGRALVERQFTWPQIAAQLKEVYEWVLGGGDRPSCVVL